MGYLPEYNRLYVYETENNLHSIMLNYDIIIENIRVKIPKKTQISDIKPEKVTPEK